MACVAVKVSGVGGANTSAKGDKLPYRKTIRIPFGRGCIITRTNTGERPYFLGLKRVNHAIDK